MPREQRRFLTVMFWMLSLLLAVLWVSTSHAQTFCNKIGPTMTYCSGPTTTTTITEFSNGSSYVDTYDHRPNERRASSARDEAPVYAVPRSRSRAAEDRPLSQYLDPEPDDRLDRMLDEGEPE